MDKFIKSPKFLLILISVIFFVVPFLWLQPGEMDLGGDSTRLYFYDPYAYLKNIAFSVISPDGMGAVFPASFFISYLLFLIGIKAIVQTPYLLITIFNILKLLGGFLAVYYIVITLLNVIFNDKKKREFDYSKFSAILAAIFYILSPLITGNWDKALFFHDQIVVYPLIFFLLLKFFLTNNVRYMWFLILIGFIFAPLFYNPGFFAFFPFAILFLIIFLLMTKTYKASWKILFFSLLIFIGLNLFHFIPQLANIFDFGSIANTRFFDKESIYHEGVRYFMSILSIAKVSTNILTISDNKLFQLISIIVPLIILLALIISKKKQKIFLLTGVFFLFTVFLHSANITNLGVEFYKLLFYIPGFSMFRNFIGQWAMLHIFFYALFFGLALRIIFDRWGKTFSIYFSFCFVLLFFLSSWAFLQGAQVNKAYSGSDVHIPIKMDPAYEETLQFIKKIPDDGKILILPYSDAFYQVVSGKEGGAYVGPSSISYLTGRKSYAGYQLMTAPFSEKLFDMSKKKDYKGIQKLLTYTNVQYIFYNSDKRIYDNNFPTFPYSYARQSLPATQKDYKDYVTKIAGNKIYENGPYQLYSVKKENYLPLFYIAKEVKGYKNSYIGGEVDTASFIRDKTQNIRTAYIEKQNCLQIIESKECNITNKEDIKVTFTKINSIKYEVKIENANNPFMLIFLNAFHRNWKLYLSDDSVLNQKPQVSYFNSAINEGTHMNNYFYQPFETIGKNAIFDSKHVIANGYANAWYINPKEINRKDFVITMEMINQRIFYYSLAISFLFFLGFIIWGFLLFFPSIVAVIIGHVYDPIKQKR